MKLVTMARNRQTSLSHGSFEPMERSVGSGGSIFEALQQPRDPVREVAQEGLLQVP